jgi:O-antigen/teichoic acid export membrane protein
VVFPVINSLSFVFRSAGVSYQEVAIALLGKGRDSFRRLRNFANMLGLAASLGLGLIAFTPLAYTWFHGVSGLSIELSEFARRPTQILTPLPFLSVLLSFQRAMLVYGRKTKPITWTSVVEVLGIAIVLFVSIKVFGWVGAVAAAMAILLGRIVGNLYLVPPCWRIRQQLERRDAAAM